MTGGVEECQISPQILEDQSRSGTPWQGGWGAEKAWGGVERTWCLVLLEGASPRFLLVSGLLESPILRLRAVHRRQQQQGCQEAERFMSFPQTLHVPHTVCFALKKGNKKMVI